MDIYGESIPRGGEAYEQEIKQVATTIATRQAMAKLDQQRVYVDTPGLKARLRNSLADDFDRYKQFHSVERKSVELSDLIKLLKEHFPEYEITDVGELMRALTSESDRTLLKLITEVRREFSVGHEFGLDGYLSGGIRHGVLESHLREPLVARHLLGIFHKNGGFSPPQLAQQLKILAPPLKPNMVDYGQTFRTLADQFQTIIKEVLEQWVRIEIRTEPSEAFFAFQLTSTDVRFIESSVQSCLDIDDFLDRCIQYWWARVDEGLRKGRLRIKTELRSRLKSHLRKFYQKLQEQGGPKIEQVLQNYVGPIYGDIDANTEQLADWFQRTNEADTGPVSANLAVDVAIHTVTAIHPQIAFEWSFRKVHPIPMIPGNRLKHWVDILLELFRNAAKNCGSNICVMTCEIVWPMSGPKIIVQNELHRDGDYTSDDQKIQQARLRLSDEKTLSRVANEGESGLLKIWKYAKFDLRKPDATVTISRESSWVTVEVNMGTKKS